MLDALFSALFIRSNKGKIVYIHNGSKFDLIFLLKHLVNYQGVDVNPIVKDGSFINLEIRYGPKHQYVINIRDSFLLLPSSLEKLAKQFKVPNLKGIFPYSFVNENSLNYVGTIPSYNYFDSNKVSQTDYNQYSLYGRFTNNTWNMKDESLLYCSLDCEVLYNVIETFGTFIFSQFRVNISSTPTLPSLAFKIFRTHYLPKGIRIPTLSGEIFSDISNAYYGGHVDMYIPKNPTNTKLFHYDINSLYPAVMSQFKYPVTLIGFFNGDISLMDDYSNMYTKYLGYFKVRITAPSINHPILPIKRDNTTIYGEGTWEGWYYSEELNNATKYGYTYKVLAGYLFDSEDIFGDYVAKMYQMKEEPSS